MNSRRGKKLRIVAFFDGRPGHEKQTRGILKALDNLVEIEVVDFQVNPTPLPQILLQTAILFLPGQGWSDAQVSGADFLIGTGSHTHLHMLLYKKKYGVPVVTCMLPSPHIRRYFDLCFVPEHDGVQGTDARMLTAGAPNCSQNNAQHNSDCGLILLGGLDPKSHHWQEATIVATVRQIVQTERSVKWTISSSPRTPVETVQNMQRVAAENSNVLFFDYRETAPGWIEDQYNNHHVVWVTADSISMIYEALTAGCKVGIIPMQWKKKQSKFQKNENLLLSKGLVISYTSWLSHEQKWLPRNELNEAQRCAERILQQWQIKN